MKKNYYEILNIDKTASQEEIKKVYRNLALIWHPDKNKTPEAPEKFKEISEAYQVLGNVEKKNDYDNNMNNTGYTFNYSYRDPFEMFNEMFSFVNNLHNTVTMIHNMPGIQIIEMSSSTNDMSDEMTGIFEIMKSGFNSLHQQHQRHMMQQQHILQQREQMRKHISQTKQQNNTQKELKCASNKEVNYIKHETCPIKQTNIPKSPIKKEVRFHIVDDNKLNKIITDTFNMS